MQYNVDTEKYGFSYQELKLDYEKYSKMQDTDFIHNIPKILHFACFVCYLKEIPSQVLLVDNGLIHELIHLLNGVNFHKIKEIRELFDLHCKLV